MAETCLWDMPPCWDSILSSVVLPVLYGVARFAVMGDNVRDIHKRLLRQFSKSWQTDPYPITRFYFALPYAYVASAIRQNLSCVHLISYAIFYFFFMNVVYRVPQEAYVDSAALAESQLELQEERAALGLSNEPTPSFEVDEVDDWEVTNRRGIRK